MTRYVNMPEKDYAKSRRAIKRLNLIKTDVDEMCKVLWKVRNKLKDKIDREKSKVVKSKK